MIRKELITTIGTCVCVRLFKRYEPMRGAIIREDSNKNIWSDGYKPILSENGEYYLTPEDYTDMSEPKKISELSGDDAAAIAGGLDMSFLANCRTNIRSIILSNCGIDELNGNVFEDYPSIGIGGSSANWSQIAYLSIQYNQLDATEVADFIVKYYDFAPHIILSTINLIQTPTVTIIDATALADITYLQYAGHVVYY